MPALPEASRLFRRQFQGTASVARKDFWKGLVMALAITDIASDLAGLLRLSTEYCTTPDGPQLAFRMK